MNSTLCDAIVAAGRRSTASTGLSAGGSSGALLEGFEEIERELTLSEHQFLLAVGAVELPDEDANQEHSPEEF